MSPLNNGIPSTLPQGAPPVRHYLQFDDFSADEYAYLLERTAFIKAKFKRFERHHPLPPVGGQRDGRRHGGVCARHRL